LFDRKISKNIFSNKHFTKKVFSERRICFSHAPDSAFDKQNAQQTGKAFPKLEKRKKEKKVGSIHKIEYLCTDYEKSRNMENPFKFGTIVEAEYFTEKNFMCL